MLSLSKHEAAAPAAARGSAPDSLTRDSGGARLATVAQPQDVALDLAVEPGEVALAQQPQDLAVLLGQPRSVALVADLASEDDHDVAGQRLPQRDDDLVVRGEADLAMELEVGLAGLDPVLVGRLAPHLADQVLERREALRLAGEIGDGIGQREALERDAGLADPGDLELVELDDPRAAMRGGGQDGPRV